MGAVEDAELVRRGYEAFSAGDLGALGELFGEDAVWHVPGQGALSGAKRGREAILAFFRELGERSQGSLRVTVRDIIGGETHTVGIHHSHAVRNGKTLDQDTVTVFVLRDGKVIECREFLEDTAASDTFWA
ncbi:MULTISPECIES: nuclear transport factor 2 family protein [Micrococcaceae]|uniref:nuclear transport factor 2 family protein n=1 Tax=Micrococcaceae TaxID=1268 RepID=UPI00160FCF99|nr:MULTISPECIES: nuclear transport factor 2 family protein [Micrococcaceae]MBB5748705.1 hypothetical protein [Micrococcus sp. TA1]HRO31437.1 nuclear transport factor 2 family protein [Citricoccus sp.]HRO94811.1 nuclear transport factor 2 family protein [Citricoccus sp.]